MSGTKWKWAARVSADQKTSEEHIVVWNPFRNAPTSSNFHPGDGVQTLYVVIMFWTRKSHYICYVYTYDSSTIVSCTSDIQHILVPAHRVCHVPFKSYLDSHGLPYLAFVVFVKVCVTLLLPRRESCVTSTLLAFCCVVSYVTVGETGTDRITLMVNESLLLLCTSPNDTLSIWMVRQRALTKLYLTSWGWERAENLCTVGWDEGSRIAYTPAHHQSQVAIFGWDSGRNFCSYSHCHVNFSFHLPGLFFPVRCH